MFLGHLLALAVMAAGVVAAASRRASARLGPRLAWEAYKPLCDAWARAWGVPALVLVTVGVLESGMRPGMIDPSARAMKRGGAWGLFGMTADTARGLFAKSAELRRVVGSRWNGGDARGLLDPQVNAAIASFYLAALWARFGKLMPTIAAYQQGPATVAKLLERGGDLRTGLPPRGREYVQRATAVIQEITASGAAA